MEFYHVLNRGVEKRDVVLDDGDRMRFVRSLYVFNDENQVPNVITQKDAWENFSRQRKRLVNIHAWCLMDNHYHLLMSSVDGEMGKISLFLKKLNGGYAKFFNAKYSRSGFLWQGKTKKIKIERDTQFMYLPYYIHLNPLDLDTRFKSWRSGGLNNFDEAFKYLDNYRWSSWQDYVGINNFPSVIYKDEMRELLGERSVQTKQVKKIASDVSLVSQSKMIET